MTINTFSHKPCSWTAAFADSMRRNRSLLIFSALLMLSAPLQVCLENSGVGNGPEAFFIMLEIAVPILLSVIIPFLVFSYLHNRRAVDLYHALPIKRTSLFIGKYLSGLLLVAAPTVLGYGLAFLVGSLGSHIRELPGIVTCVLPETIMLYTFVVFMVVCCGTIWETILYGAGLSVALIGICFSVPSLAERLYGYFYGSSDLSEWLLAFTPFYFFSDQFRRLYNDGRVITIPFYQMVVPVLFTVGMFCAALFLYQNRKSESTGAAFTFRFLFHLVSVFISLSLILTLYVINRELISAMILGFIAYFVMSVISNRGFKKLLPVFARCAAILVVSASFILTFEQTGGFGFENRVPAAEDIETVYLSPISIGDAQMTGYYIYDAIPMGSYNGSFSLKKTDKSAGRQSIGFQEEGNIRLIWEIHQNLVQNRGADGRDFNLQIVYRLKNGDLIRRRYNWLSEEDFDRLAALNTGSEYLKVKYPFMREGYSYGTNASAAIVSPLKLGDGKDFMVYETLDVSADEAAKALKADIAARPLGFEVRPNADYIGQLALTASKNELNQLRQHDEWADMIKIYACDKNILSLLEKRGKLDVLTGSMQRHTATESVNIAPVDRQDSNPPDLFKISGSYYYNGNVIWYNVTDEADRAFLISHLQPVYYAKEGCNIVTIGEYSYLLPEEYQEEFRQILLRADLAEG